MRDNLKYIDRLTQDGQQKGRRGKTGVVLGDRQAGEKLRAGFYD
jgi:hypothetical protein